MVTSDFRPEVKIQSFRTCAMYLFVNYWNSSFIMDVAMGQIPRYTERISSIRCITMQHTVVFMGSDSMLDIRLCCSVVTISVVQRRDTTSSSCGFQWVCYGENPLNDTASKSCQ